MKLDTFHQTLTVNFGCKTGDRVVIATDDMPYLEPTEEFPDRATLAEAIAATGREAGLDTQTVSYPSTKGHGREPPKSVFDAVFPEGFTDFAVDSGLWEPLQEKTIDKAGLERLRSFLDGKPQATYATLIVSYFSTSHTRFRQLLNGTGTRLATMPTGEPFIFEGVMSADWTAVARRGDAVKEALDQAVTAEICSPGGRKLTMSLDGRPGFACSGDLTKPGAFGNLPGGESYIAPMEGTAAGEVSIGYPDAPDGWAFRFDAGRLAEIIGNPPFQKELEQTLERLPDARQLCELGIGTNEKATHYDNILEAEKMLGTVHFALGDNAGFGGAVKVPFHCDYVVHQPSLRLVQPDGSETVAIRDGHFLLA